MGIHHSVIDRLMQRLQATVMVDERPRFDRSRKTTPREDRLIARCARRNLFATYARIRDELNFGNHISLWTVNIQLNEQRLRRNCHDVVGGLDGIGHLTISVGIYVIGKDFFAQMIVEFYCVPWMAEFESSCIEPLYFMRGT